VPFSAIRDLPTAKQALVLIHKENQRLHQLLVKQAKQIAALLDKSGEKQLAEDLMLLKEQMAAFQQSLFGKSSEKRNGDDSSSSSGGCTGDATSTGKAGASKDSDTSEEDSSPSKTNKPAKKKKKKQLDLPTVVQVHGLADDDQGCDQCGGQLAAWDGQFEEFEEVDVVERSFRIVKHRRQKYRCTCGCAPVTAPGPTRLRGSGFSLNFAVAVRACCERNGLVLGSRRS